MRVVAAPLKYVQGPGQISQLHSWATKFASKGAFAIVPEMIINMYGKDITSSFDNTGFGIHIENFNNECSNNEIKRLVEGVKKSGSDVVLGIGGGKAIDTAKAVAFYCKLPVVIVPTVASSDAPCSALSVIYTDDGQFESYLPLPTNPQAVVVDTQVIAKAPARLLVAGMGDALATYYEARANTISRKPVMAGGIQSVSGITLAKVCRDTLFKDGYLAKLAMDSNTLSTAVENVIEANTFLSGVGFESGGIAAAHAIHNGFTAIHECHQYFHGEKVAFGTISQLVLENAPENEIGDVISFCRSVGLPTKLSDIGIKEVNKEELMKVAVAACAPGETIHNMPFPVDPDMVLSAVLVADKLGSQ